LHVAYEKIGVCTDSRTSELWEALRFSYNSPFILENLSPLRQERFDLPKQSKFQADLQ